MRACQIEKKWIPQEMGLDGARKFACSILNKFRTNRFIIMKCRTTFGFRRVLIAELRGACYSRAPYLWCSHDWDPERGRWLFLDAEGLNQVMRKQVALHDANPARQDLKVVLE